MLTSGGINRKYVATSVSSQSNVDEARVLVNFFFLIGILGICLGLFDKVGSLSGFSLFSAAELRTERAQQLMDGIEISGNFLSGISFLTYPAGFVVSIRSVIRFERLSPSTKLLLLCYIPLLFLFSVVSGGRSTIFVMILFFVVAAYVRHLQGLAILPRSGMVKALLVLMLAAFVGYSSYIWKVRSELVRQDIGAFLTHAEFVWGVKPTSNLEAFVQFMDDPSLIQSLVSSFFYFTQSLSIIERVLTMQEVPLLLGTYHIDIVAALTRAIPGGGGFLAEGYAKLLDANVYGFFTSAWGALYIDFGLAGGYVFTFIWGCLAGMAYKQVYRNIYSDGVLLYVFWMYSILISFVSPPLGFSNSALIFTWFCIFIFVRYKHRVMQRVKLGLESGDTASLVGISNDELTHS